jgi:hypothetical protein
MAEAKLDPANLGDAGYDKLEAQFQEVRHRHVCLVMAASGRCGGEASAWQLLPDPHVFGSEPCRVSSLTP